MATISKTIFKHYTSKLDFIYSWNVSLIGYVSLCQYLTGWQSRTLCEHLAQVAPCPRDSRVSRDVLSQQENNFQTLHNVYVFYNQISPFFCSLCSLPKINLCFTTPSFSRPSSNAILSETPLWRSQPEKLTHLGSPKGTVIKHFNIHHFISLHLSFTET